jgi:hypothetical protein
MMLLLYSTIYSGIFGKHHIQMNTFMQIDISILYWITFYPQQTLSLFMLVNETNVSDNLIT